MQIENNTPFAAATLPMWHRNRKIHPILVIKTGYRWNDEGQLSALTQDEIIIEPVDRYTNDDAENASLEASADMVPFKNGFELLASGTAASATKGLQQVAIRLQNPNGTVNWQKEVVVFGERYWKRTILGWLPSQPAALEPLKLTYERAFGGKHCENENSFWAKNPVGVGYETSDSLTLPQIECKPFLSSRKQKTAPAGFGPIAPNWLPRTTYLKTLNAEAAAKGLCPYPAPLEPNLYNAAPVDQQLERAPDNHSKLRLEGWQNAKLPICIDLPTASPKAAVNETTGIDLQWDTLIVDVDQRHLYQVWRGVIPLSMSDALRAQVEISEITNG